MAFDLNPLAVTAAPLLRAIEAGGFTSDADLARKAGRLPNHIARDLRAVATAGFVTLDPLALTEDARAQLAALDRASNPNGGGEMTALLEQLEPHPLNPRKDFESGDAEDGLNELRESILLRGLMQPVVVRPQPEPGKWWIVDGERRFRAIKQANWDGDWDDDKPVPIVVREVDDREHLLLSLTANLQRANMSAIEEADAFHAAVHDFGISTEALADELGKSRRYVQQRLALLKLSDEDQDRMRLSRDDPDRLTFKAARAMTQTPREPSAADRPLPHEEFSQMVAAQPHLTPSAASAPGSSAPAEAAPTPTFDSRINDREALLLVEIADKADRNPDEDLGSEHYTRVQNTAAQGMAQGLVEKGMVGFRQRGMTVLIRPRLLSSGLKEWLDGLGFYGEHRADVLFEMRARVHGADVAGKLAQDGIYATGWLNPASDPPAHADGAATSASGLGAAHAREVLEREQDHQPDLIEPSEEEKAERLRQQEEAHCAGRARNLLNDFTGIVAEWMARERREGRRDYLNPCFAAGPAFSPEDMAVQLVRAISTGEVEQAAALLAVLHLRTGAMGVRRTLGTMPMPLIQAAMLEARMPAPSKPDPADCAADADPILDFEEAEVPEGEDEHPTSEPDPALPVTAEGEAQQPAVLIRKSVTADFIVCLEDGRKFKSLKRHLRTKYNLSPEEYRAKWGLAADYPMVAPNYAKARADLARQMGAEGTA